MPRCAVTVSMSMLVLFGIWGSGGCGTTQHELPQVAQYAPPSRNLDVPVSFAHEDDAARPMRISLGAGDAFGDRMYERYIRSIHDAQPLRAHAPLLDDPVAPE